MARAKDKRGPTREQLTGQQWSNVCSLFETLARLEQRLAAEGRLVKRG